MYVVTAKQNKIERERCYYWTSICMYIVGPGPSYSLILEYHLHFEDVNVCIANIGNTNRIYCEFCSEFI